MKIRKILSIAGMLLGLAIASTSCNSDPCKDVTCQNGGSCVDGTCVCATGYIGTSCQTVTRDSANVAGKSYNVTDICSTSGTLTYTATIAASSSSITGINITNFGGLQDDFSISTPIAGNFAANPSSFTIASQTVSGSGSTFTITGNTISIDNSGNITIQYTINDGSASETCSATYTPI